MSLKVGFKFIGLLMLMILSTQASSELTQTDVENFKYQCRPNVAYDLDTLFAPVQKISDQLKAAGQWSYQYLTENKQFSDRQISLPVKGAARVDMILKLNASDSDLPESYLWQVIVAPTVRGWKFGGHWATKLAVTALQRLNHKRSSLITMATLSAFNGQPVHSLISPRDVDKSETLNSAWVDVFGKEIVNLVYSGSETKQDQQPGYSVTFYYVPTPALRFINNNGYKWPSFKHVDQAGTVFGFVLTPEGDCLHWNSIDVVK